MRWSDERYVRWYTRDTVDWVALGWEAQSLFGLIMRQVDRAGLLPLGRRGAKGLAGLLRMPDDVVERALPILLEDGCVELRGNILVVRNFIEAQEAKSSDAQRQREHRERDRDLARAALLLGGPVTNCDIESQNVTESHTPSQPVTDGHDESQPVTPSRAVPSHAVPSENNMSSSDEPNIDPRVIEIFEYWREKLHPRAKLDDKREKAVKARLKNGYSVEELKMAVDGCALTPHNQGQNNRGERFDDLELICRTASHVDRFIANAQKPPKAHLNGGITAHEMDWTGPVKVAPDGGLSFD